MLWIRLRDFDRPLGGGKCLGSPPQRHEDLRALELQCRVLAVPREGRRNDVERPGEVRTRLLDLACEQHRGDTRARVTQPQGKRFRFLQLAATDQLARDPYILVDG